jgi:hypothetical protein
MARQETKSAKELIGMLNALSIKQKDATENLQQHMDVLTIELDKTTKQVERWLIDIQRMLRELNNNNNVEKQGSARSQHTSSIGM